MAREVELEEVQANLSDLVQWAEAHHDRVAIRRNGKVVAELVPVEGSADQQHAPGDWLPEWAGILADYPEVVESIDQVYRDRQHHRPKAPPDLGPEGDPRP